eukprot:scaffold261081_cov24-Tisochrysis_lutea.AAC.2
MDSTMKHKVVPRVRRSKQKHEECRGSRQMRATACNEPAFKHPKYAAHSRDGASARQSGAHTELRARLTKLRDRGVRHNDEYKAVDEAVAPHGSTCGIGMFYSAAGVDSVAAAGAGAASPFLAAK